MADSNTRSALESAALDRLFSSARTHNVLGGSIAPEIDLSVKRSIE